MTEQTKEPLTATAIVNALPEPQYAENFQPLFEHNALIEAVHELRSTHAVTTPHNVMELKNTLAAIGKGALSRPVVIVASCHEDVDLTVPTERLATEAVQIHDAVQRSNMSDPFIILRNRGQNTKPRSNEFEVVDDRKLASFMGNAVNGKEVTQRTPDPSRMVAAAVQARDLEDNLQDHFGSHIPAAHEALLLAYESGFLVEDEATQQQFLLSADLPWIGVRTNQPESAQVALLQGVSNPIGVKLGDETTAEHIKVLQMTLNPNAEAGKMVYMPRFGLNNIGKAATVLASIHDNDPESIILYDLHGSTRTTEDGTKLRVVSELIEEIQLLASACRAHDLRLHGVHLETMHDDERIECVDMPHQRPTHPGNVDPRLNPRQTTAILNAISNDLL